MNRVIVDFGEEVVPEEVRLVTPWEEEVPCVAEPARGAPETKGEAARGAPQSSSCWT